MLKRLVIIAAAAFFATNQVQFATAASVSNGAAALKVSVESFSTVTPTWYYYRRCCGPYFYRPYYRPYYYYRPYWRPYYHSYYRPYYYAPPPYYYRPYYRPY